MNLKSFFPAIIGLFFMAFAYPEETLCIRNQSSFVVQFTIPTHESDTPTSESARRILLNRYNETNNQATFTIPDEISEIWINLPPQLRCPSGREYEPINIKSICIMENPATIYDLFITIGTYQVNWLALLFCCGPLDDQKIDRLLEMHFYTNQRQQGYRSMCFPIYTPITGSINEEVAREVIDAATFYQMVYESTIMAQSTR